MDGRLRQGYIPTSLAPMLDHGYGGQNELSGANRVLVPFVACGDLSGYDADQNYALGGSEYVYREPVQKPIAPKAYTRKNQPVAASYERVAALASRKAPRPPKGVKAGTEESPVRYTGWLEAGRNPLLDALQSLHELQGQVGSLPDPNRRVPPPDEQEEPVQPELPELKPELSSVTRPTPMAFVTQCPVARRRAERHLEGYLRLHRPNYYRYT